VIITFTPSLPLIAVHQQFAIFHKGMNNKWSVRKYEWFVHQLATGDNYVLEVFSDIKIICPRVVVTGDQTFLYFGQVPFKRLS